MDGDSTGLKRDAGKTLLEIHTVNGKELEQRVVFDFHRVAIGIVGPNPGEGFDYYVHEYGEFDGVVEPDKSLGIDFAPIAHDGFYYRRQITIHKSLK